MASTSARLRAWLTCRPHTIAAICILAVAAWVGASTPADAMPRRVPAASDDAVCQRAAALLATGDAKAALTLIQQYRQPAVDRGSAGLAGAGDGDLATACADEWADALAHSPAPAKTPAQSMGDAWDGFVESSLLPLAGLLSALLLTWATIFLLARVGAAFLPALSTGSTTERRRKDDVVGGLVTVAISTVGFFLAVTAGLLSMYPLGLQVVVVGVLACLVIGGTVKIAHALATRRSMHVSVVDKAGALQRGPTDDLTACLRKVGDAPAGNIALPRPTDITDFVALTTQAESKLSAFVGSIIQLLLNINPWRLGVTILDDSTAIFSLDRNGRTQRVEKVGLDSSPGIVAEARGPAMMQMAAAFATLEVATSYDDMNGFYGATRWKSIGYTMIALSTKDSGSRRELLREAVKADSNNLRAQAILLYGENIAKTDSPTLAAFMDALEPMINRSALLAGFEPVFREVEVNAAPRPEEHAEPDFLMLQLLYNYIVAARNRDAAAYNERAAGKPTTDVAPLTIEGKARLTEAFDALLPALFRDPPRERAEAIDQLRQRSAISRDRFKAIVSDPSDDDVRAAVGLWLSRGRTSLDPDVAYSYATAIAQRHRGHPARRAGAVAAPLRRALPTPGESGVADDPELGPFATIDEIRRLVLLDTTDVWTLGRFRELKPALKSAGINTPLDPELPNLPGLREHLKLDPPEFRHLMDSAAIIRVVLAVLDDPGAAELAPIRPKRIAAAGYFTDDRNFSVRGLTEALQGPESFVETLAELGKALFWKPTIDEEVALTVLLTRLQGELPAHP